MLKASSDLTLPDDSQICFEYEVTPNNSIYYTDSIIIKEIFTLYHCDPVFPGPDVSITESYGLGGSALEIDIQSLETSRCAKTIFEYEFYQDGSRLSDANGFLTITDSPTTRSAKLSFYSTDPAKEGTWGFVIKEVDDGNKDDGVLSTDEHTISITIEVTQCSPDW